MAFGLQPLNRDRDVAFGVQSLHRARDVAFGLQLPLVPYTYMCERQRLWQVSADVQACVTICCSVLFSHGLAQIFIKMLAIFFCFHTKAWDMSRRPNLGIDKALWLQK